MNDTKELLQRARSQFPPPEGVMESLRRRRDHKRRNQRIRAGLLGLAIAIAVGWLGINEIRSTPPVPADPPTPTPAPGDVGSLAYAKDGDIYVADWDGSNAVRIADGRPPNECGDWPGGGEYWGEGPIWSPDGRYLAYRHRNCDRPEGARGGEVVISDPEGNVVAEFPGEGWDISWSPDSTRVAVWVDLVEGTIGVFGVDGERQALLTVPREMREAGDYDPVWFPDGESLLVPDVVIPIDGSTPYKPPLAGPSEGTYSPDGSRVAYAGVAPPDRGSLVVAEADGSNPQVVFDDWVWEPVWSPTGDRIAFISNGQLRLLDVATGTVTLLAESEASDYPSVIDFSPEGDLILFSGTEDRGAGESSLWSIGVDGSDLRRLVAGTAWGDWLTLSPTA